MNSNQSDTSHALMLAISVRAAEQCGEDIALTGQVAIEAFVSGNARTNKSFERLPGLWQVQHELGHIFSGNVNGDPVEEFPAIQMQESLFPGTNAGYGEPRTIKKRAGIIKSMFSTLSSGLDIKDQAEEQLLDTPIALYGIIQNPDTPFIDRRMQFALMPENRRRALIETAIDMAKREGIDTKISGDPLKDAPMLLPI